MRSERNSKKANSPRQAEQYIRTVASSDVTRPADQLSEAVQAFQAAQRRICELERKIAELYEPEIAKYKEIIKRNSFERDAQLARRRSTVYADQIKQLKLQLAKAETKLAEIEKVRDEWFRPEIERLTQTISIYEKTKLEWWEPQLDLREARIIALEEKVNILQSLITTPAITEVTHKKRLLPFGRK